MILRNIFVILYVAYFANLYSSAEPTSACAKKENMTSEVEHLKKHVFDACMSRALKTSRRMSKMPQRNFQELCRDRSSVYTEWRSFDLKIVSIQCDIELGKATENELKNEENLQEIYRQCYGEALEASNYHLPPDRSIELECRKRQLKDLKLEDKYPSCAKKMNETLRVEALKKEIFDPCMRDLTALTIRWRKPMVFVNSVCRMQSLIKPEWSIYDLKILSIKCDIEMGRATKEDLEREKKLYRTRLQCWGEARSVSPKRTLVPIRSIELNCREAMLGTGQGIEHVMKNPSCFKKNELMLELDIKKKEYFENCDKELRVQAIRWKTPTASIPERCEKQSSMKTKRLSFDVEISSIECDVEHGRRTKRNAETEIKALKIHRHCWDEAYNGTIYRLPLVNNDIERKCEEKMIKIETANEVGYSSCEEKKDKIAQLEVLKKEIHDSCVRKKTLMFTRWKIPTTNIPEKCEKLTLPKIEWQEFEVKILSIKCNIELGKATSDDLEKEEKLQKLYQKCREEEYAQKSPSRSNELKCREGVASGNEAQKEGELEKKHPSCAKKSQLTLELVALKKEIIKNCTLRQKIWSIKWKIPSLHVDEKCQQESVTQSERKFFDLEIARIDCDIEVGKGNRQELEKEKEVMKIYQKCWDETFEASRRQSDIPIRSIELECREKMLKKMSIEPELEEDEEDDVSCSKKSQEILKQREEQRETYDLCMKSHSYITSINCLEQNFATTKLLYTEYRNFAFQCEGSEVEAEVDAMSKEVLLKAYEFYWVCMDHVFVEKSAQNAKIASNECGDEAAEKAGL